MKSYSLFYHRRKDTLKKRLATQRDLNSIPLNITIQKCSKLRSTIDLLRFILYLSLS